MNASDRTLDAALKAYCTAPEHQDGFCSRLEAGMRLIDRQLPDQRAGGSRVGRWCRSRRRLVFGIAAAAAIVSVAAVLLVPASRHTASQVGTAMRELQEPPPASAAEKVAANVRAALGDVRTISADVTQYQRWVVGPKESEWKSGWTTADWWARAHVYSDEELKSMGLENGSASFPTEHEVLTADGSWYADVPDNPKYAGDEAAGLVTSVDGPILKDTSLGEPDDVEGIIELSLQFIRSSTLDALASGDVRSTTYEGRKALTISYAIPSVPIEGLNMDAHYFDTIRFTVDRETWLIVRTTYLLRGQDVFGVSLTNVRVNRPLGGAAKRELSRLHASEDEAISQGFRRVSFVDAAHESATTPLEPRALPAGFEPFAAAVADRARFNWWSNGDGGRRNEYWPASRDVTQLCYRSGCLQFLVTTRAQPAADEPSPQNLLETDPFANESEADGGLNWGQVETLTLTGGAWSGVTAYLVTPLLDSPHLWAWRDGVLITVGGDLTRDQVLAVANSLEPMQ